MVSDQGSTTISAPISITEQRETYIREDGSTYTREDIYVKLAVTFRDGMLAKLKGPKLSVYLCIALHCGEKMTAWPSINTIEKETGYSRRAIFLAVKELEQMQLISIEHRTTDAGDQDSNLYQIRGYITMGGSAPSAPPVVHEVHQGSAPSAPKEEPCKKNQGEERGASPPPGEKREHPALDIFIEETHDRLPSESWCIQIDEAVGEGQDDLKRWRRTVHNWLGIGWSKHNILGMLDWYNRGEIPGEDRRNGNGHSTGGTTGAHASASPVVVHMMDGLPDFLKTREEVAAAAT